MGAIIAIWGLLSNNKKKLDLLELSISAVIPEIYGFKEPSSRKLRSNYPGSRIKLAKKSWVPDNRYAISGMTVSWKPSISGMTVSWKPSISEMTEKSRIKGLNMKKAIFLSGGGARGAYQAGVLNGISDILNVKEMPFEIISGVSAGSINACFLAQHADNFSEGTRRLSKLWSEITCDEIFKASNLALMKSVTRNTISMLMHTSLPGGQYLLDTAPLHETLVKQLDFTRINQNIERGLVKAFETAATCYDIGKTVSFYHCQGDHPGFKKIRHFTQETSIEPQHIMASAAFPLFFPAIKIGNLNFGDGGLRHSAPLRASIKFGAENILVIGTRKAIPAPSSLESASLGDISFANVLGNMLNALFLDNLDTDLRLLNRINQQMELIPLKDREKLRWKKVNVLYLHPSIDIGNLAAGKHKSMPYLLRYLMASFGSQETAGDFTSFLLFEANYCQALISCGYDDAIAQKDQILRFFSM